MNQLSQKFKLQPSFVLGIIFSFIYLSTIFPIYVISILFLLKLLLCGVGVIYLVFILRMYVFRNSPQAITEFWQDSDEKWILKTAGGNLSEGELLFPVFLSNHLVILNFVFLNNSKKVAVIITADSFLIKDDFRKLKVLLNTM